MTPRDAMPIGKHKGMPLTEVKAKHPDYVTWICDQEWFEEKYPDIYEYFATGVTHSSPAEQTVMDSDDSMLDPMPDAFKKFWNLQYGKRLRVQGMHQYTALLRVACTTWNEFARLTNPINKPTEPRPYGVPSILSQPLSGKPAMLPPPLSHIPAPRLVSESNRDRSPLPPPSYLPATKKEIDEDPPF